MNKKYIKELLKHVGKKHGLTLRIRDITKISQINGKYIITVGGDAPTVKIFLTKPKKVLIGLGTHIIFKISVKINHLWGVNYAN